MTTPFKKEALPGKEVVQNFHTADTQLILHMVDTDFLPPNLSYYILYFFP